MKEMAWFCDVDDEMECIEAEGIYSARIALIYVTLCSVNYCSSGRKKVVYLLILYGGKLWRH